jgi:hypothetical protein
MMLRDKLIIYLAWYTGSPDWANVYQLDQKIFIKDKESDIWVVSIKPDNEEREYLSQIR